MTITQLQAAEAAGARIQAYTVEGEDGSAPLEAVEGRGYWRDLPGDKPAEFTCHPTRYRLHPGIAELLAADRALDRLLNMRAQPFPVPNFNGLVQAARIRRDLALAAFGGEP